MVLARRRRRVMNRYEQALHKYYNDNQDAIEEQFAQYVSEGEWGSGDDKIEITDDIFWDFVEDLSNESLEGK